MKAVVFKGPQDIRVEEVNKPKIESPNDAVIKMTTSGICGTDLHMYDNRVTTPQGKVLGHEALGVIDEVGENVKQVKPGDRVVISFNIACGTCINCTRGYPNACITMNPAAPGATYGFATKGPYWGSQAEYMRVPNADLSCLKLPGTPFDEMEDDFVLLGDIFVTAYHATELAKVKSGSTVAVFGAGPVGLLAAYHCLLKGASEVYSVDRSKTRLSLAAKIGAVPINFMDGDPVEQIRNARKENAAFEAALRLGEDKLSGVMCGIDACGYQAIDRSNPQKSNASQILSDLIRLVNPTGTLGIIGEYIMDDPGASGSDVAESARALTLPWGLMWTKNISMGTGVAPIKNYQEQLRDMIMNEKAKPSFVVSNHYHIDEAPDAYREFDKRDEVVKPVIQFNH